MSFVIAGFVGIGILGYLVYALMNPDKF
ncbi:MAG: K(+)-transporting ATPase subunit F [Proteobacteria bacterium]|nr:K(+)-transporting ATPase subunit F [Pseudomonadota bacterium]